MDKNTVPSDFKLDLVIVDSVPVLLFMFSMIIISIKYDSTLFFMGALLVLIAGICKVLWKLIVVLCKKNIWPLFIQMRILTPIGFGLMIISLFINKIDFSLLLSKIMSFPSIVFFSLGFLGMCLMAIFGFVLNGSKSKNNWIEQITNTIAQLSILLGIIFVR